MITCFSSENIEDTNSFLDELEALMEKHNVWMHVADSWDDNLGKIIEIQSLEDMDCDDSEVNWIVEATELWPGEVNRFSDKLEPMS